MEKTSPVANRTVPDRPLLAVLRGERRDLPPVWLMRQAGRYLPEYRALRAEKGGFLELCYDPESAAEVTLQPIRRFGFDGAILFSDILVIPHAMGQTLSFGAGEGPRLAPPLVDGLLDGLTAAPERLLPIYETVRRVAAALPPETTFLGFAGAPWTVATYMVAGEGSKDHGEARALAYRDPQAFQRLIDAIVAVTVDYLVRPDRRGRRGGAIVRQLGGQPGARRVSPLGDRTQCRDRRRAACAPAGRAGDRLSEGDRRETAGLCRATPAWMRSASTRRSIRSGRDAALPRRAAAAGQSRSARLLAGGAAARSRGGGDPARLRRPPAHLQSRPRHRPAHAGRACRAAADAGASARDGRLARRGLSLGEGGPSDLRDLLDGGAVHAAALPDLPGRRPCPARPRISPGATRDRAAARGSSCRRRWSSSGCSGWRSPPISACSTARPGSAGSTPSWRW